MIGQPVQKFETLFEFYLGVVFEKLEIIFLGHSSLQELKKKRNPKEKDLFNTHTCTCNHAYTHEIMHPSTLAHILTNFFNLP
jgi:hypothetical protein